MRRRSSSEGRRSHTVRRRGDRYWSRRRPPLLCRRGETALAGGAYLLRAAGHTRIARARRSVAAHPHASSGPGNGKSSVRSRRDSLTCSSTQRRKGAGIGGVVRRRRDLVERARTVVGSGHSDGRARSRAIELGRASSRTVHGRCAIGALSHAACSHHRKALGFRVGRSLGQSSVASRRRYAVRGAVRHEHGGQTESSPGGRASGVSQASRQGCEVFGLRGLILQKYRGWRSVAPGTSLESMRGTGTRELWFLRTVCREGRVPDASSTACASAWQG